MLVTLVNAANKPIEKSVIGGSKTLTEKWHWTPFPIKGIKTHENPSGIITMDSYDNYGRLINIKENGNLIQKYEYNYATPAQSN